MKRCFNQKSLVLVLCLFISVFLVSCQLDPNPSVIKQTDVFYINDHAGTLMNSTKWTILTYSIELYEDSSEQTYKDLGIDGAQIVVLTYQGNVGDINTTDIFNTWGIGKNNMGLLLVLFYDAELEYHEMVVEIGTKTSEYLSAFTSSNLVDAYFNNPENDLSDIDMRLMKLYFAFVEYFYLNVYNYATYDYQSFIDEYSENQYEYFNPFPSEEQNFFDAIPLWMWIVIIIAIPNTFLPFVFLGKSRFRLSGGGGHSRGYWFRK